MMTSNVRARLIPALAGILLALGLLSVPALAQDTRDARPVTEKQVGRSTVRFFITPAPAAQTATQAAPAENLVSLLEARLSGGTQDATPAKAVRQEKLRNGMVRAALPVELWNVPVVFLDGTEEVHVCTAAGALPAASEMKSSTAKGVE